MALPFTETWTGTNGDPWDADWTTSATSGGAVDIQSNAGRMLTGSGGGYTDYNRATLDNQGAADFDYRLTVGPFPNGGESYTSIWVRTDETWAGNDNPSNGWRLFFATGGSQHWHVSHWESGSETKTQADTGTTTHNTTINVRIWALGSAIKFKFWTGATEPAAWNHETTDSNHTARTGFQLSVHNGAAAAALTNTFDNLAITYPPPIFKAAGAEQANAAGITVPWPTHAVGDVALLLLETCGGEAVNVTNLQGFTALPDSPSSTGTGTNGTRITAYWHRATSTSMSSPSFGDAGNHCYGVILTFLGCIASGNPYDDTAADVKAAASTSMTMPGLTTTVDNSTVVNIAARDNDSAAAAGSNPANADLRGLVEIWDSGTALGNGGGIMAWQGHDDIAGSVTTTTATVTSSINAYLSLNLKPSTVSNATATPSIVALAVTVNAAITSGGATAAPATVARSVTVSAQTNTAGAVATPVGPPLLDESGNPITDESGNTLYTEHLDLFVVVNAPTVSTAGNVTATPATVALAVATNAATVTAGATATPASVALSVTANAPTISLPRTVTPATVPLLVATSAPTAAAGATATPTTVALAATMNAPAATGGATVTPSVVALSVSVNAPTVTTATIVTPATVALAVATNAPTVTAGATTTPATVALAVATNAPTVTAGAVVAPNSVALVVLANAPSVSAGGSAAPAPAVVALAVATNAPTIAHDSIIAQSVLALAVTANGPAMSAGATVQPTSVPLAVTTNAPTVTTGTTATPPVVALSATVDAPTLSIGTTTEPNSLATAVTTNTPTITTGATVTPPVVALSAVVNGPTVTAGGSVAAQPDVVSLSAALGAPTATADATAAPGTVPLVATTNAPTITLGATPTPATLAMFVVVPAPTVVGGVAIILRTDTTWEVLDPDGEHANLSDDIRTVVLST